MIDYLTNFYQLWTDVNHLPHLSADEIDTDELTSEQEDFLNSFIDIWDKTVNEERRIYNIKNLEEEINNHFLKQDMNKFDI